jgi:hypothetical protein
MSRITDATMKKQVVLGDSAQVEKAMKVVSSLQKKIPDGESNHGNDLGENEGD